MKKIIIIGSPGAGKSTLARKLADKTKLPLYYLDIIWHKPDKTTVTTHEFDARLEEILNTDRWIIDGNYKRTLEMRLQKCDAVIFLDYPTKLCLESVEKRIGTKRVDMPWVETEFDSEFKQYITDFSTTQTPKIYNIIEKYSDGLNVFILKSREQADEFLSKL